MDNRHNVLIVCYSPLSCTPSHTITIITYHTPHTTPTHHTGTKAQPQLAYECMEIFGGNGFVEEFPMAKLFRHSPLNSIWEGRYVSHFQFFSICRDIIGLYIYIVVISVGVEWCIGKSLSFSITSYNSTSIAHNHKTKIYPSTSPLNSMKSVWEGSGNVMALDVLRAGGEIPAFLEDLQVSLSLVSVLVCV